MNDIFYAFSTDAREAAKESGDPYHIINVSGEGYRAVSQDFDINRLYYHGEGGKKMFFKLVESSNK